MVFVETLLSYSYWTIPFTVHTDASDKHLGAVIIHNNKHIALFSRRISNTQHNYTTTDKELLAIVELLKQFRGIIIGYEINVFSYHKKLVYVTNLSEYQRLIYWILTIEEFGHNIQHIYGVDNIVADNLSRLPSTLIKKYEPITSKAHYSVNELLVIDR